MYIYTEINHLHNHKSLESNLSYRPNNDYNRENVTEKNLKKHIADAIIRKLKSKIK
jgi:hypothetical protein